MDVEHISIGGIVYDVSDETARTRRATSEVLGSVMLTSSSAITEETGLALPATEKNPSLVNTLAWQIEQNAVDADQVNKNTAAIAQNTTAISQNTAKINQNTTAISQNTTKITQLQQNAVTGVKGNAETVYRKGDVNITPANIGAVSTAGGTMTEYLRLVVTPPSNDAKGILFRLTSEPKGAILAINGQNHLILYDQYTGKTVLDINLEAGTSIGRIETINATTITTGSVSATGAISCATSSVSGHATAGTLTAGQVDIYGTFAGGGARVQLYKGDHGPSLVGQHTNMLSIISDVYSQSTDVYAHNGVYMADYNTSGSFCPLKDNVMDLGAGDRRYKQVYAANSAISTSDERKKKDVRDLDEDVISRFIMGLRPISYVMIDGDSGRSHWGFGAQSVEDLMYDIGLTSMDFAGWIKSPKTEMVEEKSEEGKAGLAKLREIPNEYDYGLRYEEFIAPIVKVLQRHEKKIKNLENMLDY